eukprot:8433164-Alexandrium_andersonii.AAC.1
MRAEARCRSQRSGFWSRGWFSPENLPGQHLGRSASAKSGAGTGAARARGLGTSRRFGPRLAERIPLSGVGLGSEG